MEIPTLWNYFWSLTLGVPWYHCTKQAQENTTVLTLSSVNIKVSLYFQSFFSILIIFDMF